MRAKPRAETNGVVHLAVCPRRLAHPAETLVSLLGCWADEFVVVLQVLQVGAQQSSPPRAWAPLWTLHKMMDYVDQQQAPAQLSSHPRASQPLWTLHKSRPA